MKIVSDLTTKPKETSIAKVNSTSKSFNSGSLVIQIKG